MTEKGFGDGVVSRVVNAESKKKYVVSTAKEIGKDYWTTGVLRRNLFGLWVDFANPVLCIIRNSKEDAYKVHEEVKMAIKEYSNESDWIFKMPSPKPPDGWPKEK